MNKAGYPMFVKLLKDQKGLTLIELIIVVIILGILLTITFPIFQPAEAKAREVAHQANVRILYDTANYFKMMNPTVSTVWPQNSEWVESLIEWPNNPLGTGEYEVVITADSVTVYLVGEDWDDEEPPVGGENPGDGENNGTAPNLKRKAIPPTQQEDGAKNNKIRLFLQNSKSGEQCLVLPRLKKPEGDR